PHDLHGPRARHPPAHQAPRRPARPLPLPRPAQPQQLRRLLRADDVMDPVVSAVSPEDTALTSGDRSRAEDLVGEIIMRCGIWTARWQVAGPRRALLFAGFAWLIIATITLRFTLASVATDVLAFLVAAVAGFLAHDVTGRTGQGTMAAAGAAGPAAEADRMRAALLVAVSHDLRSPLAAAAAAVSCLRSADLQ